MISNLKCQWCGFSAKENEFDLDEQNNDGFWCPICDGHNFFNQEQNDKRRILLLLENNDGAEIAHFPATGLKKRLSPLRYPGGKSKLVDFLAAQFQPDKLDTFVEVFAGGASLGLSLLDGGRIKHLILNDLDPGVYTLWETILSAPDALLSRLSGAPPCRDTYHACKATLAAPGGVALDDLAWAELVCNRLSYSGIIKANALGGKRGSQETLLSRWNPGALAKRILHIHSMRDKISVCAMDACKLIEEYCYWDNKTTLFIDPPYVLKGKALYTCFFTEEDHRRLAFLLESLYQGMPGADIVITYDDCQLVRDLYPLAITANVARAYSI